MPRGKSGITPDGVLKERDCTVRQSDAAMLVTDPVASRPTPRRATSSP
jgi:hypothetical protein